MAALSSDEKFNVLNAEVKEIETTLKMLMKVNAVGDIVVSPEAEGTITHVYKNGKVNVKTDTSTVKIQGETITERSNKTIDKLQEELTVKSSEACELLREKDKNDTNLHIPKTEYVKTCPTPIYKEDNYTNFMVLNTKLAGGNSKEIIQLSYNVYDTDFKLIKSVSHFINENTGKVDYDNYFTLEQITAGGISAKKAFSELSSHLKVVDHLIIHNVDWHVDVILRYFSKLNIKCKIPITLCTMQTTTRYCQLPNNKYPKLDELYFKCFNEKLDIVKTYDGSNYVDIVFKCFKYLCGK